MARRTIRRPTRAPTPARRSDPMFERLFGDRRGRSRPRRPRPARPVRDREVPGPPLRLRAARSTSRRGTSRSTARSTTRSRFTWDEFKALPRKQVTTDIHCVTRWTKLDTHWEGVAIQTILELAQVRPAREVRRRPRRAGLHGQRAAVGPRRRRRPARRHVRRRQQYGTGAGGELASTYCCDDIAAAIVLCPLVDGLRRALGTPPKLICLDHAARARRRRRPAHAGPGHGAAGGARGDDAPGGGRRLRPRGPRRARRGATRSRPASSWRSGRSVRSARRAR